MLKQATRENIQALVQFPEFDLVNIQDQKMMHSHNEGKPTFYVHVNIHAHGQNVFSALAQLIPELQVSKVEPFQTDHGDYISYGDIAVGRIEEANVTLWATIGETPIEKAPLPEGATLEISQDQFITESEVVANG
jgi:hypothetical protein